MESADYDYGLYDVIKRPEENGGEAKRVVAVIILRKDKRIWYLERDVIVNELHRWWVKKELEFVENSQVYSKMLGHVCAIFGGNKRLPVKKTGRRQLKTFWGDKIIFYSDGTVEIACRSKKRKPGPRTYPDLFSALRSRDHLIKSNLSKYPCKPFGNLPEDVAGIISHNASIFNMLQREKKQLEKELVQAYSNIKLMISEKDIEGIKKCLDNLLPKAFFNPFREQVKDAICLLNYYLQKTADDDKPMILEMVMAVLQRRQC